MRFIKNLLIVSAAMFTAGFLQACFSDSNANNNSGLSKAEVEAMIAAAVEPLEQRIAELEASGGGERVIGGSASNGTATLKMTADGTLETSGQDLGTLLGYIPSNVPVYESTLFSLRSPKGYLYAVPNGPNKNGAVGIREEEAVYYESPDCSGQAFAGYYISAYGAEQGSVFRVGDTHYYVAAGTPQNTIAVHSKKAADGACQYVGEYDARPAFGYRVSINDPEVTGVASAPIPTPIVIE